MLKDTDCGVLRREHIGARVTLAGWVHRWRDHGNLIFVDLRDREGVAQVVFNPEVSPEAHRVGAGLRSEWVARVRGEVRRRPAGTENPRIPTGEVEVVALEGEVLNGAHTPPFEIDGPQADELLRLRYRYLDLRRPAMRDNLLLRHRMVKLMRDFLDERGFLEIETPILIKSTPEGARDYLVPSRLHPGHFYALPQSPQQLKQLLMVGGLERYFQIARCFRDEDLRADRQPEFTQLDVEMSFVERDDVLDLMEELHTGMVGSLLPERHVPRPFPRLSYREAMKRYASDRPDLRFGMEVNDLTDIAATSGFQVFRKVVEGGGVVKGLAAAGCAGYSRREIDDLTAFVRSRGAGGLVSLGLMGDAPLASLASGDVRGPVAQHFAVEEVVSMAERMGAGRGDLLLLVAGDRDVVTTAMGQLRHELGHRLGLADPSTLAFAFIVDFPLLEWDPDSGRWGSSHHPFTAPRPEDTSLLDSDPGAVRSQAYDLVCNGVELASGSVRIHQRPLQERIMGLLGYGPDQVEERFGQLLGAMEYGAPPHAGIAAGVDRLAVLLSESAESIRDVIAFPKTQSAVDPLFGAPAPASEDQLAELHLRLDA